MVEPVTLYTQTWSTWHSTHNTVGSALLESSDNFASLNALVHFDLRAAPASSAGATVFFMEWGDTEVRDLSAMFNLGHDGPQSVYGRLNNKGHGKKLEQAKLGPAEMLLYTVRQGRGFVARFGPDLDEFVWNNPIDAHSQDAAPKVVHVFVEVDLSTMRLVNSDLQRKHAVFNANPFCVASDSMERNIPRVLEPFSWPEMAGKTSATLVLYWKLGRTDAGCILEQVVHPIRKVPDIFIRPDADYFTDKLLRSYAPKSAGVFPVVNIGGFDDGTASPLRAVVCGTAVDFDKEHIGEHTQQVDPAIHLRSADGKYEAMMSASYLVPYKGKTNGSGSIDAHIHQNYQESGTAVCFRDRIILDPRKFYEIYDAPCSYESLFLAMKMGGSTFATRLHSEIVRHLDGVPSPLSLADVKSLYKTKGRFGLFEALGFGAQFVVRIDTLKLNDSNCLRRPLPQDVFSRDPRMADPMVLAQPARPLDASRVECPFACLHALDVHAHVHARRRARRRRRRRRDLDGGGWRGGGPPRRGRPSRGAGRGGGGGGRRRRRRRSVPRPSPAASEEATQKVL